jgi:hypothetical protein
MSKYSEAEIAARDAVIQALYDNVPQNTLTELWRHYLGLRTIAEERPKTFPISSESNVDLDNLIVGNGLDYPYNFADNPVAAGTVDFTGSDGTDTISLSL